MSSSLLTSTEAAYDTLACAYDDLTAGYCHDLWLERIEALALTCGLRGRAVLDVACGTGKSFMPLLERGYAVTACDVSGRMVEIAQRKSRGGAQVLRADMRLLPRLGTFDLVLCLDDAVNYLLDEDDLVSTFRGIAASLARDGLFVFDVNALQTYRTTFAGDWAHETDEHLIVWRGEGDADAAPGTASTATVEVLTRAGDDDLWRRRTSVHRQRHWPTGDLVDALERAGLRLVACKGQQRGARLHDAPDDPDNHKILFVAAPRRPTREEEP